MEQAEDGERRPHIDTHCKTTVTRQPAPLGSPAQQQRHCFAWRPPLALQLRAWPPARGLHRLAVCLKPLAFGALLAVCVLTAVYRHSTYRTIVETDQARFARLRDSVAARWLGEVAEPKTPELSAEEQKKHDEYMRSSMEEFLRLREMRFYDKDNFTEPAPPLPLVAGSSRRQNVSRAAAVEPASTQNTTQSKQENSSSNSARTDM